MIEIKLSYMKHVIKDELKKALNKAAISNQFVTVGNDLNKLGKTTALIEFAKENGYCVVTDIAFDAMRQKYDYEKIYDAHDVHTGMGKVVIDTNVDLTMIIEKKLNVVTGYRY